MSRAIAKRMSWVEPGRKRNAMLCGSLTLGRVKKISCLSSEIFDEIRAGGRIFFYFLYTVYVGCVSNPAARCVTVGVAVYCTWRRR